MKERLKSTLETYVADYARVKKIVLLAEELDVEYRSNISPIKELRDAGDHLTRFLAAPLSGDPAKNEDYQIAQIDKAKGHLFRAGYDAIDGIVVSNRIRISQALTGVSNDAIAAVYPKYYERYAEFESLCREIGQHREDKDIGSHTRENLEGYWNRSEQVANLCKEVLGRLPILKEWDRKNRKGFLLNHFATFVVGVAVGVVGLVIQQKSTSPAQPKQATVATKLLPSTNATTSPFTNVTTKTNSP